MLHTMKKYVSERQKGLAKAVGIVGGLYMVRGYIRDRIEEVRDRLERERVARENLKRRFEQTQENISYTVLALIQTLSDQVLVQMDVEGLTQELQSRSKARHTTRQRDSRPPSSLASSIDFMREHDARSEVDSIASTSYNIVDSDKRNLMSASEIPSLELRSWVESSGSPPHTGHDHANHLYMSDLMQDSVQNGERLSVADSGLSDNALSTSFISDSSTSQTTTELWNEVKLLTFTRTLTTLYSTTLLILLTVIQLSILARTKYVHSVMKMELDERLRERFNAEFSIINLLLGHGNGLEELMSENMDGEDIEMMNEDVEGKYLTMTWWILHVGWKDVGERVRKCVEEVFDRTRVSLKGKLAAIDLYRLIGDVRRRLEHEVTFEGYELRINFNSSLLPSTPETVQHVLTQGGFTSHAQYTHLESVGFDDISASQLSQSQLTSSPTLGSSNLRFGIPPLHNLPTQDAPFAKLLEETCSVISSSDFAHVLEVCLDRATDVLFSDLEKSMFISTESSIIPGETVRIRLAGLLPELARWSHLALNGTSNEFVDSILNLREVKCLCYYIFEV